MCYLALLDIALFTSTDLCSFHHNSYSGKYREQRVLYDSIIDNFKLCLTLLFLFLQFGFMLIALIWKFDFSPFMVLIIAILNDGKIL